jgi:hypothetical protein
MPQTLQCQTESALLDDFVVYMAYVHNKITHSKKPAPAEASKRFLLSYMDLPEELIGNTRNARSSILFTMTCIVSFHFSTI